LVEESEQLSQLENAIERTVGAVRDQPGNLDPVAIERSMSLINQYQNDAKVAADFSRAKFLLGEARSVGRQLVVR
jgi:hypothetical protein